MTARKAGIVAINWPSMFYACIDVYCACGEYCHVDVHDKMQKSPEYIRCPHCTGVFRLAGEVELVRGAIDFKKARPTPSAHIQWKGTELHGTAQCGCGQDDAIYKDFAYDHKCTGCGAKYKVEPHIGMQQLTPDEVAALPADVIITPHRDEEDDDMATNDANNADATTSAATAAVPFQPGNHEPLVPDDRILIFGDIHAATPSGEVRAMFDRFRALLDEGKPPVVLLIDDEWPFMDRSGSMGDNDTRHETGHGVIDPSAFFSPVASRGGTDVSAALKDALGRLHETGPYNRYCFVITDGERAELPPDLVFDGHTIVTKPDGDKR